MSLVYVGVDTGNGNTKCDTGFVIQSGVKQLVSKPAIEKCVLTWNDRYYVVNTAKMEIQKSKMSNNDILVSTMAAIADKFKTLGMTSGEIRLGVGLPLTLIGREKKDFQEYFMRNQRLTYRYEGVNYSVYILSVDVFPQGYAAVVNKLNTFETSTIVIDVGSWTIDILPIVEGQPDVSRCKSLSLGTFTAISEINENLRQKFGEEAEEAIIKDVMINGSSNIDGSYLAVIQDGLYEYVDNIMNNLATLKFNTALNKFIFMGGGATVVKNFSKDLGPNITIIEDICINAKGYEDILKHKYEAVR
ncbi:MAG: ParM/StbA family protein [Butyrivibrio sp.]|nr:ParM/StbA family protein [Butyrivibrio sp.]